MSDWRRLEGSNVDPEMTEGLSARVADPLWSLCRQWQVGEFHGEDAASPLFVQAEVETIPLRRVQVGGTVTRLDATTPVESLVESEPVHGGRAEPHLRLESGRALLDRLRMTGHHDAAAALRNAYLVDEAMLAGLSDALDPVGAARLRFLRPRSCDAAAVGADWVAAGRDGRAIAAVAALADAAEVGAVVDAWARTEPTFFDEPADGGAWVDDRLEYQFRLVADSGRERVVLEADEYPGGSLDWYAVDIVGAEVDGRKQPAKPTATVEVLASPLRYAGQPVARFWEFEDGDVSFGDLAGGPEDLARSVIAAFGALAGEDWLLVPVTLPVGTLARVRSVHVVDGFGGRWEIPSTAVADVEAAKDGTGSSDRPWRFFELTGDPGPVAKDPMPPLLFLPPVVDTMEVGRPIEAIEFRRDEMANLAWGIERRVESPWGRAVDRDASVAPRTAPEPGQWDFTLATAIPPSWVPLVPVRRPGSSPEVVLQRGRLATDDLEEATAVQSVVLSRSSPFLLREEVIPAGGVRITRRYQFARDHQGGTHLWLSRRKTPASGPTRRTPLRFDELRSAGGSHVPTS